MPDREITSGDIEFHGDLENDRTEKAIGKLYEKWAGQYDEVVDMSYINKHAAETLAKFYQENQDEVKILDVPCGTGVTGQVLFDVGFKHIDGYDACEEMIKVAQAKNLHHLITKGCITADETLSCVAESYEGIISVGGISRGHIQLIDALNEFIRVLKPNGYMAYTVRLNCFDINYVLEVHRDLIKARKIELIMIEKSFFYMAGGKNTYCHLCVMKKL